MVLAPADPQTGQKVIRLCPSTCCDMRRVAPCLLRVFGERGQSSVAPVASRGPCTDSHVRRRKKKEDDPSLGDSVPVARLRSQSRVTLHQDVRSLGARFSK
ncbi:hypothetical protein SKAU_G00106960 [Synaphobranchus kaupii]|uniref:Uncharacterized protein n=1 Tax=Synaphobranchus kaupii TaxID=118154 RepID=A0A9Q1J809_SYNKA|nr:hypothetical protein SKAU_G00106960 [Synaphobranchus kaupii]